MSSEIAADAPYQDASTATTGDETSLQRDDASNISVLKGGKLIRLQIERGGELVLGDDDVMLSEGSSLASGNKKKIARNCMPSVASKPTKIPLYNVLWAELSTDEMIVTIDYAKKNGSNMVPASLAVQLAKTTAAAAAATGVTAQTFVSALIARAYRQAKSRRRARVLINPKSGKGDAVTKWRRQALPIFEAARYWLTVTETTHAGNAGEVVASLDVDAFDCIVVASGDGLAHEVFNGLGRRSDAGTALARIAVGLIPCGSGNALASNAFGTLRAAEAALAIIKGVVSPLDLSSVTQKSGGRMLSFLSQNTGMLAECDLATEDMRWMGTSRFTIGYLQRAFSGRVYPCDLVVKYEADDAAGKDGMAKSYRRNLKEVEAMAAAADGWEKVDEANLAINRLGQESDEHGDGAGLPRLKYGTVTDPLPEDWKLIRHDKLGTFLSANMAFMTPDMNFFPTSAPTDGMQDYLTIDNDAGGIAAVRLLLEATPAPTLFHNPRVNYRKVSAYRYTPREQESGYIAIDGERVPFEPFQVEVHRGLGRVILRRWGVYEAQGPRDST